VQRLATVLAVIALLLCTNTEPASSVDKGGSQPAPTGAGSTDGFTIISWAAASNGPSGGTGAGNGQPCHYWIFTGAGLSNITDPANVADPGEWTENGVNGHLYQTDCLPGHIIFIPNYTPKDLALIAYQQTISRLTNPTPVLAPPLTKGGYVNLKTWIAIDTTPPVTATASIPGLTVSTAATPDHIEWDPGDGTTVTCTDLGAHYQPGGPTIPNCGWTPRQPSAAKFTGTDDLKYHGTFRLVWTITWTATNGTGGNLGSAVTHQNTNYTVYEIQTIGNG
jgi:hypothetical protein